jgi:hypothetical protein
VTEFHPTPSESGCLGPATAEVISSDQQGWIAWEAGIATPFC